MVQVMFISVSSSWFCLIHCSSSAAVVVVVLDMHSVPFCLHSHPGASADPLCGEPRSVPTQGGRTGSRSSCGAGCIQAGVCGVLQIRVRLSLKPSQALACACQQHCSTCYSDMSDHVSWQHMLLSA
jgi:hypothetical protein